MNNISITPNDLISKIIKNNFNVITKNVMKLHDYLYVIIKKYDYDKINAKNIFTICKNNHIKIDEKNIRVYYTE